MHGFGCVVVGVVGYLAFFVGFYGLSVYYPLDGGFGVYCVGVCFYWDIADGYVFVVYYGGFVGLFALFGEVNFFYIEIFVL